MFWSAPMTILEIVLAVVSGVAGALGLFGAVILRFGTFMSDNAPRVKPRQLVVCAFLPVCSLVSAIAAVLAGLAGSWAIVSSVVAVLALLIVWSVRHDAGH
jgi:hypothetical protein